MSRTPESPEPPVGDDRAAGPDSWMPAILAVGLLVALAAATAGDGLAGHTALLWFLLLTIHCIRVRQRPWVTLVFGPGFALFALWFLGAAQTVTLPFAVGLLAAYLLDPVIDRLEPRFGRTRAIVVLMVPILAILGVLTFVLVPALIGEAAQLAKRLPELREPIEDLSGALRERLTRMGIELHWTSLGDFVLPRLETIANNLLSAGVGVWRGVQGVIEFVSFLVITPVIGFYLLRDFDRLRESFLDSLHDERRAAAEDFFARIDGAISGYLRGQLLVGVVIGSLFALGLTLLGMDYALLVGISAVVLNLVPYVGSVLTAALALSVALLSDPSWVAVAKVGGLYAAVQMLDGAILSPRIMGDSLSLHPAYVMLAVLVAGQFFGVVGVIVAVPAAAVLKESLTVWMPQLVELLPMDVGSRRNRS